MNDKGVSFLIGNEVIRMRWNSIIYFEVMGNYLKIYTVNSRIFTFRRTLRSMILYLRKLEIESFVKINKSIVINTLYCRNVTKETVVMINEDTLPIAVNRKNKIYKEILCKIALRGFLVVGTSNKIYIFHILFNLILLIYFHVLQI